MRIETDGQEPSARAKHAPGLADERAGIAEVVQRVDAEQSIEARRWPRQLLRASSRETRERRGRSRALEHLSREIDSCMPARPIPQRSEPVPGAAADLGDIPGSVLTRFADEALEQRQHAIVATRLPAPVVFGCD